MNRAERVRRNARLLGLNAVECDTCGRATVCSRHQRVHRCSECIKYPRQEAR